MLFLGLEEGYFLIFWKIAILISIRAVPVCTFTSNERVSPLPYNLSSMSCHQCFWSYKCKMNLRVVLLCISLMAKEVEHFLKYLSTILNSRWGVLNLVSLVSLMRLQSTNDLLGSYYIRCPKQETQHLWCRWLPQSEEPRVLSMELCSRRQLVHSQLPRTKIITQKLY